MAERDPATAALRQAQAQLKRALEVIRYVEWSDDARDGFEDHLTGLDEALAALKAELRARRPPGGEAA